MAKAAAKPSPFAPARLPEMPAVPGVRLAACEAGIRYAGRTDLMMAVLDPGTTVAGVLTRSKTCSAPVLWCRENLQHGKARALVVNSGNANAFTGKKGSEATRITAEAAAKAVGCDARRGLRRLDRRHRRAARCRQVRASARRARQVGQARRLRDRDPRDHDDRHLPQARDAHGRDRWRAGHHQRLLQGRRHDRTRHGDHALLHLHGCGHRARGAAEPALQARADDVQLHDHRRRHLDQRHLPAVRHRRGGEARPEARRRSGRSAPRGIRRRPARSHARPRHPGRQGRRRPLQVRHHRDQRRRELGRGAHNRAQLAPIRPS